MNIRRCRGNCSVRSPVSPTSCPFRKSLFLATGMLVPAPTGEPRHGAMPMTPNQCAYRAVQARRSLPHGQRPPMPNTHTVGATFAAA
jgi:hypothetical protein